MADLVRARTEIECLIADFNQAGEFSQRRREEVAKDLEALEARIEEVSDRLGELGEQLDARILEEREAREK